MNACDSSTMRGRRSVPRVYDQVASSPLVHLFPSPHPLRTSNSGMSSSSSTTWTPPGKRPHSSPSTTPAGTHKRVKSSEDDASSSELETFTVRPTLLRTKYDKWRGSRSILALGKCACLIAVGDVTRGRERAEAEQTSEQTSTTP